MDFNRTLFFKLFFVTFLVCANSAKAEKYTLTDDDVIVNENGIIQSCSYTFELTDIIIPEVLDGYSVKGITNGKYQAYGVFYNKGITSIVFPSSMVSIGDYAFSGNNIKVIDLSNCTSLQTIGKYAFRSNSYLADVDFSNCPALVEINDYAFYYLDIISLDFSGCPELTRIGKNAFYSNKLRSVDISRCTKMIEIGSGAFQSNQYLNSLTLPTPEAIDFIAWRDQEDTRHEGGSVITDLSLSYVALFPHILTDDDVLCDENGIIQSCSYNFFYTDIIIPDRLDGYEVKAIADQTSTSSGVFCNKGITSIQLPATITKIGDYAFCNNAMDTLDLFSVNGLTEIGKYSFYNCGLQAIEMDKITQLEMIGMYAFYSNEIDTLDLSRCSNLTMIDDFAFKQSGINKLIFTGCASLDTIGNNAFERNPLGQIDFTGCINLLLIGQSAFSSCTLTAVDLSGADRLLEIGESAFNNNYNLESIQLPALAYANYFEWRGEKNSAVLNDITKIEDFYAGYYAVLTHTLTNEDVVVDEKGVIISCSYDLALTDIIIPEILDGYNVKGIAGGANADLFFNKRLTYVRFPSTIETIGDSAFYDNKLMKIDISACHNLKSIGVAAFCFNNIYNLDLSRCIALQKIGSNAFYSNAISTLNIDNCRSLTSIGSSAFNSNNLKNVDFSLCNNIVTIGAAAFAWNRSISSLNLSGCDALREIGSQAFGVNAIKTIDLSPCSSLKTIGDWAFLSNADSINLTNCYNLESIGWQAFASGGYSTVDFTGCSSLRYIGKSAFNNNRNLDTLIFTGCTSLATIDEYAFYNCNIANVDLTPCIALKEIGSYAFRDNSITSIMFPDGLTNIRKASFNNNQITSVNGVKSDGIIFRHNQNGNIDSTTIVSYGGTKTDIDFIPEIVEVIDTSSFENSFITTIDFTSCPNLTRIGDNAFKNNLLTNVNLFKCLFLIDIGNSAFYNNNIDMLNLSTCAQLLYIGERAFYNNIIAELSFGEANKLSSIGTSAFYGNSLDTIDLTRCKQLVEIGSMAFSENRLTRFVLPIPEIRGKNFNYWFDGTTQYNGEEVVYKLYKSYVADLYDKTYTVSFQISNGSTSIANAEVKLLGYGSETSSENGIARFSNVLPSDDIYYKVSAEGYLSVEGAVSLVDEDVITPIVLSIITDIEDRDLNELIAYPNPAKKTLNIIYSSDEIAFIYNANGILVEKVKLNSGKTSLGVENFKEGLYFIKIGEQITKFFVKN
ncbi:MULTISPECIES: leucine-rich repeat protein [unclassified Carboxylicivirga]|uniref:leucine-rich repeat protein n=1 Tax=Carboxylicivirga TaxID=1628153 RepID=UPI003D3509F7